MGHVGPSTRCAAAGAERPAEQDESLALLGVTTRDRDAGGDRRVLIVAAEFPPLGGGGVIRATKLAKYLARDGWGVTVVCSDDPLGDAVDHTLLEELPATVSVIRVGSRVGAVAKRAAAAAKQSLGRRGIPFRVLFRARSAVRALTAVPDRWIGWAWQVARMSPSALGHPAVVISTGPPHSGHIGAALLHRRLGVPFIVDYRDEWVLNPFYRSRLPWRRLLEPRIERWCLRRASHVVFVSQASAGRYAENYPDLADRFEVIPNGFDPDDLPADGPISLEPVAGPLIGHAGSISNRRDAATFFRSFGTVVREGRIDPPPRLLLVGPISADQLATATASVPEAHLEVRPFMPHRQALALMSACDVLLVLTNAEEAGPAALTGKIFEYLALRKPILTIAPTGPATQLMEETGAGISADPMDAAAIEQAIVRVVRLASDRTFRGAPAHVIARFDRSRQAERWAALLDDARRPLG